MTHLYKGMVIEIKRARSDRNAAKFNMLSLFHFYLEIFCAHLYSMDSLLSALNLNTREYHLDIVETEIKAW